MKTTRRGLTGQFDRLALRGLMSLPPRVQRLLAGRPVEMDGQTLAVDTQLMLRARALAKAAPVEEMAINAARAELRYQQRLAGAGVRIGEVREIEVQDNLGTKVVVVHHGSQLHRRTTLAAPTTGPLGRDAEFHDKVRVLRTFWAAHRDRTAA